MRRASSTIAISIAVIIGVALGAGGMYLLLLKPIVTTAARSDYLSAVAQAKLTALELELLRKDESIKLSALLESRLDTHLLKAGSYEEVEPAWRDKQVDESITSVRNYRSKHPSQNTDAATLGRLARTLSTQQRGSAAP